MNLRRFFGPVFIAVRMVAVLSMNMFLGAAVSICMSTSIWRSHSVCFAEYVAVVETTYSASQVKRAFMLPLDDFHKTGGLCTDIVLSF